MKWHIEFKRNDHTINDVQRQRLMAVEVIARNQQEAKDKALAEIARRNPIYPRIFTFFKARKI